MKTKYWFRPKRIGWKFAAYYPVSWQGWLLSITALMFLVYTFLDLDKQSHTTFYTWVMFAPRLLAVLVIFDILTRFKGEYPSWWKWRK